MDFSQFFVLYWFMVTLRTAGCGCPPLIQGGTRQAAELECEFKRHYYRDRVGVRYMITLLPIPFRYIYLLWLACNNSSVSVEGRDRQTPPERSHFQELIMIRLHAIKQPLQLQGFFTPLHEGVLRIDTSSSV